MAKVQFGGDVNNTGYVRQLYPEAGGATVGVAASPLSPYAFGTRGGSSSPANTLVDSGRGSAIVAGTAAQTGAAAGAVSATSHPITWLFVLAILLVALMWVAERFGSEKADFKNLKLSAYNIIVISLAAIIGINVFKAAFGRFHLDGLSDVIANA